MAVIARFSINPIQAIRLELPYYDLYISEWGAGTSIYADGSGIVYPFSASDPLLLGARGLAIHPQSDVDRVIVQADIGIGISSTAAHPTAIAPLHPSLSVQAPMTVAPPTIMTPLTPGGATPPATLILRAHPDAIYHSQYAKSGTSTLTPFAAAVIPITEGAALTKPILAVRVYLTAPPVGGTVRTNQYFPLARNNIGSPMQTDPVTINAAAASGEQLFAIIPVHGRGCVMTAFRAVGCSPSVRVAVCDFSAGPPSPTVAQLERTIYTSAALTPDVPVQIPIAPYGDWLMLYYTPSDGDNGTLQWFTRATDGC